MGINQGVCETGGFDWGERVLHTPPVSPWHEIGEFNGLPPAQGPIVQTTEEIKAAQQLAAELNPEISPLGF